MLTIGEFSSICQVSTKTLRYYAEIGLLQPYEINRENGYRYYAIEQLETMLMIERLKTYGFSLEEIKALLEQSLPREKLYQQLIQKKQDIQECIQNQKRILMQLEYDLHSLEKGKSMMAYMENISIQLVEVAPMNLLSHRCMVEEAAFQEAYEIQFQSLLKQITMKGLTIVDAPLVLFHSADFTPQGMDTEFAFPIQEKVQGTRVCTPGLCIKSVLHGSYSNLSSVYAKQWEWMEKNGYQNHGPLFEQYMVDPEQVKDETEYLTEIYQPVQKKG